MTDLKRRSPVRFDAKADEATRRDDWDVVRAYADEGDGPWLADLSHCPRWDLQDGRLDHFTPAGLAMPASAGACRLEGRILVNRMNRTQAAVWHLGGGNAPSIPADAGYTDVSEATVFWPFSVPVYLPWPRS